MVRTSFAALERMLQYLELRPIDGSVPIMILVKELRRLAHIVRQPEIRCFLLELRLGTNHQLLCTRFLAFDQRLHPLVGAELGRQGLGVVEQGRGGEQKKRRRMSVDEFGMFLDRNAQLWAMIGVNLGLEDEKCKAIAARVAMQMYGRENSFSERSQPAGGGGAAAARAPP